MRRRGCAGEVVDVREAHPSKPRRQVPDDVPIDDLEPALFLQVRDVASAPGQEVIKADDTRALFDQAVAEVRPNEPGTPGDKRNPFRSSFHS